MNSFDQHHQSVLNQYNAETINVFVEQSRRNARIQWRSIEILNYTVREDSDRFRTWFVLDSCRALHEVFSSKGYKRFTALFSPASAKRDDQDLFVYGMYCHEIKFVSAIRARATDRILLMERAHGLPVEDRTKIATEYEQESSNFFAKWHVHSKIDFSRPGVLEFEYDPDAMAMSVRSKADLSLDPLDYEHRVETTSELLSYVGATWTSIFGFMGDIEETMKNWPLLKVATRVLDKAGIEVEKIRINADDYEQWDYINPELDAELAQYRRKAT